MQPGNVSVISHAAGLSFCPRQENFLGNSMEFCFIYYIALNSEAQMDKFKSRMLRGMETTVESSGKIDQIKLQIAEKGKVTQDQILWYATATQVQIADNAKTTHDQVKALSDAVQSQQAQIQQIHASVQLILQKLNP
jgi:hypothetical protein